MVPSSKSIFIAVGVLCCLLVVTAVILFTDLRSTPQVVNDQLSEGSVPVTEDYVEIEGTVTSVDEEKRAIYVSVLPSGERKEVQIWPDTKIVKTVTYGTTTETMATTQEYNISNIPANAQVQIRYGAEDNDILTYVDRIYLGEVSFEDLEKEQKPAQLFSFIIVSFDTQTKTLTYKGRSFITDSDFEQSIVLSPETPIYKVDAVRAGIFHARVLADVSALSAGKNVYLIFKPAQENGEGELESVIVAD